MRKSFDSLEQRFPNYGSGTLEGPGDAKQRSRKSDFRIAFVAFRTFRNGNGQICLDPPTELLCYVFYQHSQDKKALYKYI
ncbi:hypothetical protein CCH79_00017750 [Gambusia affinis]|uniref:Uncharacterized protein n=1 Tax=Gambusia affinis TaxID=33528 RepID=A0A315UWK7_GAMAF|nr:hypothetical protein CCH79_00017750 [Gambusia affinis]